MSRKQEIYRDMLSFALPLTRNSLSRLKGHEPDTTLDARMLRVIRSEHAVAQLVHGLANLILEEEFTDGDISFLNFGARSFYKENAETCSHFHRFAYHIQELFKAVPKDKRLMLQWEGSQGNYSWARPESGRKAFL